MTQIRTLKSKGAGVPAMSRGIMNPYLEQKSFEALRDAGSNMGVRFGVGRNDQRFTHRPNQENAAANDPTYNGNMLSEITVTPNGVYMDEDKTYYGGSLPEVNVTSNGENYSGMARQLGEDFYDAGSLPELYVTNRGNWTSGNRVNAFPSSEYQKNLIENPGMLIGTQTLGSALPGIIGSAAVPRFNFSNLNLNNSQQAEQLAKGGYFRIMKQGGKLVNVWIPFQ